MFNQPGKKIKKKILLIGPLPSQPLTGGIATGIQMMLDSDLKSRYEFILLNRSKQNMLHRKSLITLVKRQLCIILKLVSIVLQHRPHVIHIKTSSYLNFFTNSLYILIAKCFFRKTILQIHGGGFLSWYSISSHLKKTAIRSCMSLPDRVLVLSSYWMKFFSTIIASQKIGIVPNGVKVNNFRTVCEKPKFTYNPNKRIAILFLGSPDRKANIDKGIYDALKAFQLVHQKEKNVNLLLAGFNNNLQNGEINDFLRKEGLNDSSRILGILDENTKFKAFAETDIFILPSYYENMPNTVLEAMAAGLPIVSSSVGAIPEMIEEGVNGFLVQPGDYEGLGKKILKLVRDPQLRKRMGETNLRKVRLRYDFRIIAAQLEREYEYLIRS